MATITPRHRYAALINNQNPVQNLPPGCWVEPVTLFGSLQCTWIESNAPDFLDVVRALPGGQCFDSGDRHVLLTNWLYCVDVFRASVRPEHIDALAALKGIGTVAQYEAAVDALVAECGYPAP